MKKIVIISAIALTSSFTAITITRGQNKLIDKKLTIEKADLSKAANAGSASDLGTAD